MNFNIKHKGRNITDFSRQKILKSPAITAYGISTTILPSDPNELCDRMKLFLQEKQAGNNSDIIIEEFIAIVDNFLEYKRISKKQHTQLLNKYNLLHIKKNQV